MFVGDKKESSLEIALPTQIKAGIVFYKSEKNWLNFKATRQTALAITSSCKKEAPAPKRVLPPIIESERELGCGALLQKSHKIQREGNIHLPLQDKEPARSAPARGVTKKRRLVLQTLIDREQR